MQIIENQNVVTVDIDNTLFMHTGQGVDEIINPYSQLPKLGSPHIEHFELMKEYKGRGFFVVVWSAAGVLWAKQVIEFYGLEDYVDLCMTKPNRYVDDAESSTWMGNRVFIPYIR